MAQSTLTVAEISRIIRENWGSWDEETMATHLGSRVTGDGPKYLYESPKTVKKVKPRETVFQAHHTPKDAKNGDHLTIDRNVAGEVVAVTVFLDSEGKSLSVRIDEIRQHRFIKDPDLLFESPEDFINIYGPGLIDMVRYKYRKEQAVKQKAKVDASEAWMTDEQREVIRSLAE